VTALLGFLQSLPKANLKESGTFAILQWWLTCVPYHTDVYGTHKNASIYKYWYISSYQHNQKGDIFCGSLIEHLPVQCLTHTAATSHWPVLLGKLVKNLRSWYPELQATLGQCQLVDFPF